MKFSLPFFILTLCLLLSCNREGDITVGTKSVRLTTKVVENITASSAQSGGSISNDGGTVITERGVVWSTARNPTIALSTKTSDGMGSGVFSSRLTGLLPSTTYFARAYATNQAGTEYGNEISFVTETNFPTLTTSAISNITSSTVISGGAILKDGGNPILARGVVWSTAPNPIITLATKTNDGTGTGNFISTLTGLSSSTQYYLRSYATNAAGTSYGNEIVFVTDGPWDELDVAIANKMAQYNLPGLSVAILRNEKLAYLKSYGYSNREENIPASNNDLYRIADASKVFTWIATQRLEDDWASGLDERVFGSPSILGKIYLTPPIGSDKDLITVRHFLEHKSGWVNTPYDPMLANNSLTQSQIINDLLINRPLTYPPGTTYYDLNFGYCVLGRVIEKVTNITYEQYVKSIMNGFGVTQIRIGGNNENERFPDEVKYYQEEVSPYSLNMKRMDAHAGWIASAKDLAKIMVRMDGNLNVQDIISITPQSPIYPPSQWVQYGSLPGSSSILHRLDNTYSFIVLTNTRTESNPAMLLSDLDNTLIGQIRARASWPSIDLF
jgi:CubicO group peptidase (beta-lactamase class C family)